MDSYNKLKSLIEEKSNPKIELTKDQQKLFDLITNDKKEPKSINDIAINYKEISKSGYNYCLLTYKDTLPVKKDKPLNKLDDDMKDFYILKLYINKDDELLEMTLSKSEKKKDINLLYLDYLDKINFLDSNEFFKCLIENM